MQALRLMDQVRTAIRLRHYSRKTEKAHCYWIRFFIRFHHLRHPAEMSEPEVSAFLSCLAVSQQVSASTQNQAFNALVFLYKQVLEQPFENINGVVRAKQSRRIPVVFPARKSVPSFACWINRIILSFLCYTVAA